MSKLPEVPQIDSTTLSVKNLLAWSKLIGKTVKGIKILDILEGPFKIQVMYKKGKETITADIRTFYEEHNGK
jgi:hypothetical protein